MTQVRLTSMSTAELDDWRRRRRDSGDPRAVLPDPVEGEEHVALAVTAGGERVGTVLLLCTEEDGEPRCSVLALETDLPTDDTQLWAEVLTAVADRARATGAAAVTARVESDLAPVFERAGYHATSFRHGKRLEGRATGFQDDRRVDVRPMREDERRAFAAEVGDVLAAAMPEAGLPSPPGTSRGPADRVARLGDDPAPADELLITATVDGEPVGRVWATVVVREDDGLDFYGNLMEIFPEHRGRGLTRSLIGSLARYLREIGVRDVFMWASGDDERTRSTYLDAGVGVHDVHLQRDLDD